MTEIDTDPNETIQYTGPAIWAFTAYRLDLAPSTAVTIWVEAVDQSRATELFNDTAGAGMAAIDCQEWKPNNLAHHLRWMSGTEGNLAAIIQRQE